jgi:hypothetical protein
VKGVWADHLEQLVIITIIDWHSDDDRSGCVHGSGERLSNFVRGADHHPRRSERFGVFDRIIGTQPAAGASAVFENLLLQDHVVGAVDPDHMNDVQA